MRNPQRLALLIWKFILAPYIDTHRTRVQSVESSYVVIARNKPKAMIGVLDYDDSPIAHDRVPLLRYAFEHKVKDGTATIYLIAGHYDRWMDILFLQSVKIIKKDGENVVPIYRWAAGRADPSGG